LDRDLPAEALSDRIVSLLLKDDRVVDDDVAFLLARVTQVAERFEVTLPAEPGKLVILRRLMERWLISKRFDDSLIYDVVAATGESAANAIEHAYGPDGGAFTVLGELDGERLTMKIIDVGGWR